MSITFTYATIDDATIALLWRVRLADPLRADLAAALDVLPGVERVEVWRYGGRVDIAPHAVEAGELEAAIADVLTLVVEPVVGPIQFEVDSMECDCPGCRGSRDGNFDDEEDEL